MIKLDLKQGSQEWLDWRKTLLTATDAAVLLGKSPYATPYKGWLRKMGRSPEQVVTDAMRRGQTDEPIARQLFNEQYKMQMEPACIQSELFDHLGASLDGISPCGRYILEIKSQDPEKIANGVPADHMCQIQHQIMCGDRTIEKCYYVTFWKHKIYVIEVYIDLIWQADYYKPYRNYWKCIENDEPPELTDRDYLDRSDSSEWNAFAEEYKRLNEEIKAMEAVKEGYRKALIQLCDDQSSTGGGIKVLKKTMKGRIDYTKALEQFKIKEDDLHQFRKASSITWTIMLD